MSSCIFCKIIAKEAPADIIFENEDFICFMDIFPVSNGHCLFIPKEHHENFAKNSPELMGKMMVLLQKIAPIVAAGAEAPAFQLVTNVGKDSGQEVFHTHFHIIPRKKGAKNTTKDNKEERQRVYNNIMQQMQVSSL